jgi:hypothetical protein
MSTSLGVDSKRNTQSGVHVDRELLTKYLPVEIKTSAKALADRNVVVHQLDTKYFG